MNKTIDEFTNYEILMIKSFAINSIVSTRINEREPAIVEAVLGMLNARGLVGSKSHLEAFSEVTQMFKSNKVINIIPETSEILIMRTLQYLRELDITYHKSNSRGGLND